jgi:hypothetical protein
MFECFSAGNDVSHCTPWYFLTIESAALRISGKEFVSQIEYPNR